MVILAGLAAATASVRAVADTHLPPYERCGYCHALDGNPHMGKFPRLAGQSVDYLEKELRDFRAGRRVSTMQAEAELLSDDDIVTVARYFNRQAPRPTHPHMVTLSPAQRRLAERLDSRGDPARGILACDACHGAGGRGSAAGPRLATQHATYLEAQLLAFKRGERVNDGAGIMRTIARAANLRDIRALARYFARLGGQ